MEIDYEAAWRDLQEALFSKRSWGQDELFREMTRLELSNRAPSGAASLPPRSPRPASGEHDALGPRAVHA